MKSPNNTIRHHIAALGRRVLRRAQAPLGLEQQASLFLVYYNFCRSHASLRLPLYIFQERGLIQVKGKGELLTYFLIGKKEDEPQY